MAKKPETELVRAAMGYLQLKGWKPIRVNSGMVKANGGVFRGAAPGTSDIIACSPYGVFAAFEAKVGRNKPTQKQIDFIDAVKANGGIAGVFYNLDELHDLMEGGE